jgi:hypothetical protein
LVAALNHRLYPKEMRRNFMSFIQWFALLGALVIIISLVVDGFQQSFKKRGKKLSGVLQLSAIIVSIIVFFEVITHFIEKATVINILLICLIILYLAYLITRFSFRKKTPT